MDILMIIDAITFFSLQNVLDYEGDVEADMCMTFQVERLACFSIGPEPDHWLCLSVTPSVTDSCLVNLMPVNDVADVDAEDHIGNSLLQIWELTFGPEAKLLFRL